MRYSDRPVSRDELRATNQYERKDDAPDDLQNEAAMALDPRLVGVVAFAAVYLTDQARIPRESVNIRRAGKARMKTISSAARVRPSRPRVKNIATNTAKIAIPKHKPLPSRRAFAIRPAFVLVGRCTF